MDKAMAKQSYKFDPHKPVLAIMGGSQGSVPLNRHFENHYKHYTNSNVQILWQCGKNDHPRLKALSANKNLHIIPFTENMNSFYSAADVIVSRAGALALSEMSYLGKAMVLIPFPHSAGDHQYRNAKTFSNSGAALLITQSELNTETLENTVLNLINNPDIIGKMEEKSREMGISNATEIITQTIMEIARS